MSFLYKTVPVIRIAARPSTRLFSTTLVQHKIVPDAVKEPIKKVDRAVSDKLVDALNVGESAKDSVVDAVGAGASEAKAKASEVSGEAKGKASEVAGEARGKAKEVEGEAKSKM